MKIIWTSAIAAAACISATTSFAAAEDRPLAQQSRVGVEIDYLHTSGERIGENIMTSDIVAQIGLTRHVFLDADISAALFASQGFHASMVGNPMIGAHYAGNFNRRVSGYAGLSIGLPIASASNPTRTDDLGWVAVVPRAWHDPYRFVPHIMPVVARAGLEVDLAPVFLRGELSPGMLFGFDSSAVYVDVTATAGVRASFGLEGGVRGQGTFVIASENGAQTAIEPFIGYSMPDRVGLYARYGLLVALDAPFGFGPDGLHVVTHRVALGAKF